MAAVAGLKRCISGVSVAPHSVRFQLARNTFWSVAGSASSQGSSLLAALLLGRMLGVAAFGKVALIQATVILLGNVGEMGFALTTTKFVSRWRTVDPEQAGRLIGWTLRTTAVSAFSVALLLVVLGPHLGISALTGLSTELRAACGVLVFDMLNRIQLAALSGLEAFESTARVQASRGVLMLPCVWLGTMSGGLLGAILAMSFVSLATCAIGHWILKRRCRSLSIYIDYRSGLASGILTTSMSLWAGNLLLSGSTWVVTLLLSRQTSGFSELGLFNAADKWKTALTFLPQMLFQVTLPMLSHRQAARDHRACTRIVSASLGSTLVATGTAALLVASLSRVLMSSYGVGFKAGASVLLLTAAAAVPSAIYTVGAGTLWALGKPAQMLAVDVFKTSLLLALCWSGLASSAWNLALAYLLSFTAGSVVIMLAVRRQLGALDD
ncbi:MAG: polysaccharide biosynthesis protein [Bryobacterales bacterium]|nr:polysaccharide biosynthesis protein [Bryobacterales bacterium]